MSDRTEYTNSSSPIEEDETQEKRPCMVMIRGDFIGQVYELKQDVIMIGRSDDVDLVVSDVSISRRHAMIAKRAG